MQIQAHFHSTATANKATLTTNGTDKQLSIPVKATGGAAINGGEMLLLAIATCFVNDIYREAAATSIVVETVEVWAEGIFGKEGEPASVLRYRAKVKAPGATAGEIEQLVQRTDAVAEVHNTLRLGLAVELLPG